MSNGNSLLYLDSEQHICSSVETYASRHTGYTLKTVSSFSTALKHLAENQVSCFICEYTVPDADGLTVVREVRDRYPSLPVILFPASGSEQVASDAMAAGVTDYVPKFSDGELQLDTLFDRISGAVDESNDLTSTVNRQDDQHELVSRQFELATNAANIGIWDWDMDSDTVRINEQSAAMVGYNPEYLTLDLSEWQSNIHPEDIDRVKETVAAHRRGETESYNIAYRHRTVTNEWKWIRDVGETIERDNAEKPSRALGVRLDIDEQKRIENRLREERNLFTQGPTVIFRVTANQDYPVTYVSDNVETVFGYSPSTFTDGKLSFIDIVHDEDVEAFRGEIQDHLKADATQMDLESYRVRTKDGDVRWVLDYTIAVTNENKEELVGYLVDITEQKKQERQLERYKEFVNHTPDHIAILDEDGVVTYQSQVPDEMMGYNIPDVTGQTPTEYLHPSDVEKMEKALATLRSNPDESVVFEYRVQSEHGDWIWFENRAFNYVDTEPINGILVSVRDIDDRKKKELELQREKERLDEFASFVSHDLRNPLNVAQLRLDLLMQETESEHAEYIASSLSRMEQLVEDLLLLSRQGESVGNPEPIQLEELATQARSNVESSEGKLNLEIDNYEIHGDRSRLKTVFENLYRNSVEHGSVGIQTVSNHAVENGGTDITITVGTLDDKTGFYIEDDGEGIPSDLREQIFESGYSSNTDGTGIGLAIVKQIVEAHGWRIIATESEEGGARFEIFW